MQKPGLRILSIAAVIVVIVIIVSIAKSCGKSGDRVFIYEKITKGEVKKTISVTGTLDIIESVTILTQTGGVIEKIYTDFNQNVSKGQLLAKLDSEAVDLKIFRVQGALDSVKLEIQSSERNLESVKNLYKDNLISKRAMEQAEISHSVVLNKYKQTKLDYDLAIKDKGFTRIYSPINGIVIAVFEKEDTPISASRPLFLLTPSLSKMLLTISVDESDIGNVKKGQQVVFTVSAFPDKIFNGTINQVRINPVKTSGLVTYEALVICDNNELLLKPGMTATATVVVEKKADVLRVLNQAFIISPDNKDEDENGMKYVWKKTGITSGKPYKKIEIKQGLAGDMYTEIISGLKEGDEVMTKIKESK